MIVQLTHIPIFNRSVLFVGGCDIETAVDTIYKFEKMGSKVSFTEGSQGGVDTYKGDVFVWVEDLSKASVVAHELAHTACSIMDLCNIPLCAETEELMCYLIGYLKIKVQDRVYEKYEKQLKR